MERYTVNALEIDLTLGTVALLYVGAVLASGVVARLLVKRGF